MKEATDDLKQHLKDHVEVCIRQQRAGGHAVLPISSDPAIYLPIPVAWTKAVFNSASWGKWESWIFGDLKFIKLLSEEDLDHYNQIKVVLKERQIEKLQKLFVEVDTPLEECFNTLEDCDWNYHASFKSLIQEGYERRNRNI